MACYRTQVNWLRELIPTLTHCYSRYTKYGNQPTRHQPDRKARTTKESITTPHTISPTYHPPIDLLHYRQSEPDLGQRFHLGAKGQNGERHGESDGSNSRVGMRAC